MLRFSEDPKTRTAQWIAAGLVLVGVAGLILGNLIQFLWNVTLAEMFEFPSISFWQAIGLFVLAKFFFGFGGGTGSRKKGRKARGPDVKSEDMSAIADDETFQRFWREEGRESFEAYRKQSKDQPDHES